MGEWARPCTERDTIKIVLTIQTSARGRKSWKGVERGEGRVGEGGGEGKGTRGDKTHLW